MFILYWFFWPKIKGRRWGSGNQEWFSVHRVRDGSLMFRNFFSNEWFTYDQIKSPLWIKADPRKYFPNWPDTRSEEERRKDMPEVERLICEFDDYIKQDAQK